MASRRRVKVNISGAFGAYLDVWQWCELRRMSGARCCITRRGCPLNRFLFDPVPVGDIPKFGIPGVQDHPTKGFGMRRHPAAVYERYNGIAVFGQHIVQLDRNFATFCQITGLGQFVQHRVIGWITELVDVFALPLLSGFGSLPHR